MKHTNRIKILEFPMFSDYIIHIELTSNIDKTLSKYEIDGANTENIQGLVIGPRDIGHVFVFFPLSPSINTIAHESSHAVDRLMSYIGADDGEVKAYLIGYLVDEILKLKRSK